MTEFEKQQVRLKEWELRLRQQELDVNERQGRNAFWKSPLLIAVATAAIGIIGNAYLNYRTAQSQIYAVFAQRQVDLAVEVLKQAPNTDGQFTRMWALDVITSYSSPRLPPEAREELMTPPEQ